jgi:hypothetical protein
MSKKARERAEQAKRMRKGKHPVIWVHGANAQELAQNLNFDAILIQGEDGTEKLGELASELAEQDIVVVISDTLQKPEKIRLNQLCLPIFVSMSGEKMLNAELHGQSPKTTKRRIAEEVRKRILGGTQYLFLKPHGLFAR